MSLIKIDGSWGEAGGAIVRVALALSTITGKPFEITDIRKGRCNPGLKAQHLHCIKALERFCSAKSEGVKLGSTYLKYFPGEIKGKTVSIDIGTAGSISLLLQALLLPAFFADQRVRFKIKGGTDGKWAQPYDYFENVFVPQIKKFVQRIQVKLVKRGYYPKGNGEVDIIIKPKFKLKDFDDFFKFIKNQNLNYDLTEKGKLLKTEGISHASELLKKPKVAERQADSAKAVVRNAKIVSKYYETLSPGSGIVLWAMFENSVVGGDALGEKGKRAEIVGREAGEQLIKQMDAPVDRYLADQILPFMALAGDSKIKVSEVTNHCKTNIYVIEKFLDVKFKIKGNVISV